MVIAVGGIIIKQINPDFFINGQEFWGLAMLGSTVVYILVSLLGKRTDFNMDKMLHRGEYAVEGEKKIVTEVPSKGLKMLGMGKEFTRGDKIIYIAAYTWTFAWTIVFLIGTWINLTSEVPDSSWMSFWRIFILINTVASVFIIIWFAYGGTRDLREMLRRLATATRNHQDDGFVKKETKETVSQQ
jgi:SSS family solute:Na+ symporter